MSVNYYATKVEKIATEGSGDGLRKTVLVETRIHIGKTSVDNAFMLHIYPDLKIVDTHSLWGLFYGGLWKIETEHGVAYPNVDEFLRECVHPHKDGKRFPEYRCGHDEHCDFYDKDFS